MMHTPKILLSLALTLSAFHVNASDFIRYPSNQAQTIPSTPSVQILHFWATWCKPCRQEMPHISNWYAKTGKKQKIFLVGIALDQPEEMAKFLKEVPVQYPIWRYTGTDSRQMMKAYGNQLGGLPYMIVRVPQCGTDEKIIGEVSEARLNQAVQHVQAACKKTLS